MNIFSLIALELTEIPFTMHTCTHTLVLQVKLA